MLKKDSNIKRAIFSFEKFQFKTLSLLILRIVSVHQFKDNKAQIILVCLNCNDMVFFPARNFSHSILYINCFEKSCLSRDFKISLTLLTLTVLLCMSRLVIYAVIVLNACINEMVFEIFLQFPNHRYNTFLVKKGNYCK